MLIIKPYTPMGRRRCTCQVRDHPQMKGNYTNTELAKATQSLADKTRQNTDALLELLKSRRCPSL